MNHLYLAHLTPMLLTQEGPTGGPIIESLIRNPAAVFWGAIALIVIVPSVTGAIFTCWYNSRKAELDASLKMRMIEMGMSAEDIERVLGVKSSGSYPDIEREIG